MQQIIVHPSSHPEDDKTAAVFAPEFQKIVGDITDAIRQHPQPRDFYSAVAYNMTFPWSRVSHPAMSMMSQVVAEYVATLPLLEQQEASTIIFLEATREMNMVGGRPSDCARSAVADHRAGILTPESFRKAREFDR